MRRPYCLQYLDLFIVTMTMIIIKGRDDNIDHHHEKHL